MNQRKPFGMASVIFAFALLIAIVLTVLGVLYYLQTQSYVPLLAGIVSMIVTLVAYGVGCQTSSALREWSDSWHEFTTQVNERLQQFSVMINLLSEQQLISERAKSIAFRDKDHDALNRAIREEMAKGEYDAALLLVNDAESMFGYKQEADQFRAEIAQLRDTGIRRDVQDSIAQIEREISAERWDEALALAEKTAAQYPGHEMTVNLPDQVRQRKESVKQQLLQRWRDAVARKDVDESVQLLRTLDIYVTPEEVSQLKDGALEIFKARIERLREQFTRSVHEKRWNEAQQVGQDIIQEFPTSKLAQEVRENMETLRTRAREEAVAAETT